LTLQEFINTLPSNNQFNLAIKLSRLALPIWNNYADKNDLSYRDTVVGLNHLVDKDLLRKTINSVEKHVQIKKFSLELSKLRSQFDDPIVALQDGDWDLSDEVKKTFYSVFNLLEHCLGKLYTIFGELTIYVSINQAVDALEKSKALTVDEIRTILEDVKSKK